MRPRPCIILLWVLAFSTTASRAYASERQSRRGTLLVTGSPEALPVLYVAAGTVTRVHFPDLMEPHALPAPGLQGHLEVAPLGEDSLVISPTRDLETAERLLLPVTGRTKTGETLTLTLALVTREDAVDTEAWVSQARALPQGEGAADSDEVDAVARRLLASHEPEAARPRLALDIPGHEQAATYAGDIRVSASAVLRMGKLLFVTVLIQTRRNATSWRLIRANLEAECRQERPAGAESRPLRITSGVSERNQLYTLTALLPEGADCLSLTLEEDGPRTLRLDGLKVSP